MVEGDIETVDWLNWLDVCEDETPYLGRKSHITELRKTCLGWIRCCKSENLQNTQTSKWFFMPKSEKFGECIIDLSFD